MRIEVSDGLKDSLNDGMVAAFEHWLSDKLPQEGKAQGDIEGVTYQGGDLERIHS